MCLGSDLWASDIRGHEHFSSLSNERPSEALSNQCSISSIERGPDRTLLDTGSKLLSLLHPFSFYQELIHSYFLASHTFTIAQPLILGALPQVKNDIAGRESRADGDTGNDSLSLEIFENTARPLTVPASMAATDFHTLFTGQNLRWDFIGLIFTLAGRFALVQPSNSTISIGHEGEEVGRDTFVQQMMMASSTCITLTRRTGMVNDILLWLLYYNLVFTTMQYGDSSR